MERGLVLPASPVLLRTPMTERNASLHRPPHRPELCALTEVSVMVPPAGVALLRVQRVPDRHQTIVLSVLLARTSSTEAVLAPMEMVFAPVLV